MSDDFNQSFNITYNTHNGLSSSAYPVDNYWILGVVLAIVVIIAVIFIIIFTSNNHTNQQVGQSCNNSNYFCTANATCQNNICQSNIGQYCNTLNDCVSTATACYQQTCTDVGLGSVNQFPPCQSTLVQETGICKSPIGGSCQSLTDCVAAATQCTQVLGINTCIASTTSAVEENTTIKQTPSTNIYSIDGQLLYNMLSELNIVDAVYDNYQVYMLTSDDNILRLGYYQTRQQLTTMTRSALNVKLHSIMTFHDIIYVVSAIGELWHVSDWTSVNWAPKNIIAIDRTLDGDYLWIQVSDGTGYYYTTTNINDTPVLLRSVKLSSTIRRRHGRTINTYLDIDLVKHTAIRQPRGDSFSLIHDGILLFDGSCITIDRPGKVKFIRGQAVYIY